ncbi:MAG: hypothetical protein FJ397_14245 [Verrucomicrobia bacterium]|nr:hypothetical protein [Verrucomicrobiota bacterium]
MNTEYDRLIPDAAKLLGRYGIEAGFVIPTPTAMDKSIMDATWPLREYFARTGFHDFRSQPKGTAAKRLRPLKFVEPSGLVDSKVSLYRPETKDGDPRIWIYGLTAHAAAGDLIALLVNEGCLYAVNCSRHKLVAMFEDLSSFLGRLAARLDTNAPAASELLKKLRGIGALGFVPSQRPGDTGIGFTLEALLGIAANSSRSPDYRGIELKAGRMGIRTRAASSRHVTLFAKTPAWDQSPFSARAALETYGYRDPKTNRLQLFCSVDAAQANSLGFLLEPRSETDQLVNRNINRVGGGEDVFLWLMDSVRQAFSQKHRETFWIGARAKTISGLEHFHFVEARHTRNPPLSSFERLLASGKICVDLTMSEKGERAVRDHGYLFRIYGSSFDELFPEVAVHPLA